MKYRDSWRATWEAGTLHVSGVTDLFPDDFSTASLQREDAHDDRSVVTYRLVFNRDKEHYCDTDRVGAVNYYENSFPLDGRRITVVLPDSHGAIQIDVPSRLPPGT